MNNIQKQSVAKYFYDISKGVALVAVVGTFLKSDWSIYSVINGCIGTLIFFIFGYLLEGGIKNE